MAACDGQKTQTGVYRLGVRFILKGEASDLSVFRLAFDPLYAVDLFDTGREPD